VLRMRILSILSVTIAAIANMVSADAICIEAPYPIEGNGEQRELAELSREVSSALNRFPSIGEVFETVAPDLCVSNQMDGALAYLDVQNNQIFFDEDLSKAMKIGVLLHELRHLWQFTHNVCPSDDLAMKEYARAIFALEADASAISLLVAWDMKESGEAAAWEALSAWYSQSDIASNFAATIAETGDPGLAVTSAFYQWYASSIRIENYYFSSCSDYLDRQDASHAIPQYRLIPAEFFMRLCKLPDGAPYDCGDRTMEPG